MKKRNGHKPTEFPDALRQGLAASDEQSPGAADDGTEPAVLSRQATDDFTGESGDTLTLYLRDVRRTTLFTPEEEYETAMRAHAGEIRPRARRRGGTSMECLFPLQAQPAAPVLEKDAPCP